ncbi:MAG: nucleoside-triphosphatase [Bacteroidales bacterium]
MKNRLSEIWIKASITGTIWAASEIVLGSFLHNLRVPFSGNILTAIGLVILISTSYKWSGRGLFWRAGLICALLKTMSPSAVIFGPMIAIFTESLLLEASVLLLGRTLPGFLLGSMLAMSWNLFQKIINYLIFYGASIIDVYTNLINMARKQLAIESEIVWLPLIILLVMYALFGIVAGVIGMRAGRKLLNEQLTPPPAQTRTGDKHFKQTSSKEFKYSIPWLILNITLVTCSLLIINLAPWYISSPAVTLVIVAWTLRYKRALRQISKPKFWVFFVIITALTALAFSATGTGENKLLPGLLTGLQMNFRAAVIIVGFAVLGTELYNPVIRNFFMRSSFRSLHLAMELSAESLPGFISNIPDLKSLVKNPVSVFSKVILESESRFIELSGTPLVKARVYLITGKIDSGKTTFVNRLSEILVAKNIRVRGIITTKIIENGNTTGFDLVVIGHGIAGSFLRIENNPKGKTIGRFSINQATLQAGKNALNEIEPDRRQVIIIDEVGRLELSGDGWADEITRLTGNEGVLILTARDVFAADIISRWNLTSADIIRHEENDPGNIASGIESRIL